MLQDMYDVVFKFFDEDEFKTCFYSTYIISQFIYWVIALALLYVDMTGKPDFIYFYKIKEARNVKVFIIFRIKFIFINLMKNEMSL